MLVSDPRKHIFIFIFYLYMFSQVGLAIFCVSVHTVAYVCVLLRVHR